MGLSSSIPNHDPIPRVTTRNLSDVAKCLRGDPLFYIVTEGDKGVKEGGTVHAGCYPPHVNAHSDPCSWWELTENSCAGSVAAGRLEADLLQSGWTCSAAAATGLPLSCTCGRLLSSSRSHLVFRNGPN